MEIDVKHRLLPVHCGILRDIVCVYEPNIIEPLIQKSKHFLENVQIKQSIEIMVAEIHTFANQFMQINVLLFGIDSLTCFTLDILNLITEFAVPPWTKFLLLPSDGTAEQEQNLLLTKNVTFSYDKNLLHEAMTNERCSGCGTIAVQNMSSDCKCLSYCSLDCKQSDQSRHQRVCYSRRLWEMWTGDDHKHETVDWEFNDWPFQLENPILEENADPLSENN